MNKLRLFILLLIVLINCGIVEAQSFNMDCISNNDTISVFLKNIIKDTTIQSSLKLNTIDDVLKFNYSTLTKENKSDITLGLLDLSDLKLSYLMNLCREASKHQDYYIFDFIEGSEWFSKLEIEDKYVYYINNSTLFSNNEDHHKCIEYLLKAINHAQQNNRDDLNFFYGSNESEVYHNYYKVASESSDTCDIIKYSLMNINSIKRNYGIQSKEFLKAIMFPIKKGVLEDRKARTNFIYSSDSMNEVNPQLQQLFQQYDTVTDLHQRSLILQNATNICLQQKLDSASYAECVYYAGVHWTEIGELSRGYNNIFQSIHLYSRHCKKFFSSMHDCERIARMAKAYYAYGDKISSYILNKILIEISEDFKEDPNDLKGSLIFNNIKLSLELSLFDEAESLIGQISDDNQELKFYMKALYYHEKGKKENVIENWKQSASYFEKISNSWVYGDERSLVRLQEIYSRINDNAKLYDLQNVIQEIHKSRLIKKICHLREAERVNALEDIEFPIFYVNTKEMVSQVMNLNLFRKGIMTASAREIANIVMEDSRSSEIYENFRRACRNNEGNYKIDSLENILLSSYISCDELYDRLNFDIDSIRGKLNEDVLLVDFEYAVNQEHLYAYITSHKIRPQIIQLCHESFLDTDSISVEDKISKILHSLMSYCKDYNTIYFIQTFNLVDLPIENYIHKIFPQKEVHRLFNIYSLISKREENGLKSIVLVGNPKYNNPLEHKHNVRGNFWGPLPGTEEEIMNISKLWRQSKYDVEIKMLLRDDATETNIYDLDGMDVNILHFATHGYSDEMGDLCSLLLTGANISILEQGINAHENDGVLSSLEIETLYLPKLSLVVLSACDTGRGTYLFEDGVWGLQRAFHKVGAQNMIVSLKKVDDDLTQAFMINFYKNLTTGKSIYNSFWEAMDNADEDTRNSFILIE